MNRSVLYICYFGLREPLVQTQVLPYLRGLASAGYEMQLLTFERHAVNKWPNDQALLWRSRLREAGIEWCSLRYHRRPSLPATAFDIAQGACLTTKLVKQLGIELKAEKGDRNAGIVPSVSKK